MESVITQYWRRTLIVKITTATVATTKPDNNPDAEDGVMVEMIMTMTNTIDLFFLILLSVDMSVTKLWPSCSLISVRSTHIGYSPTDFGVVDGFD